MTVVTPERLYHAFSGHTRTNHLAETFDLVAMRELVRRLGDPQDTLRVVHVGGTAGKGSVARMTADMLQSAGHRVGLYTKPHMHSLTERFVVDGVPVDGTTLLARAGDLARHLDGLGASWFEAVTALALRHFVDSDVDVAVVEVGMGGLTDATNVVRPLVSVVTNVGDEHLQFLGGTLPAVARHKAAIIKAGSTAVSGVVEAGTADVVRARCAEVGAPLRELGTDVELLAWSGRPDGSVLDVRVGDRTLRGVQLGLVGRHQAENAALALAAVDALAQHGLAVPDEAARAALAGVRIPGRFEVVADHPLVVLDGAHCAPKLRALGTTLSDAYPGRRRTAVLALSPSQDPVAALAPFVDHVDAAVVTTYEGLTEFGTVRGLDPVVLAGVLSDLAPGVEVVVEADPVTAYHRAVSGSAPEDVVCVTGSFSLVSTVRSHVVDTREKP